MDTSQDIFYFTDGSLAYAGHHYHDELNPVHSHSFVEIAFVIAGSATHLSLGGRQRLGVGDVVLLRPGVWHGWDDCRRLDLYNCCFSGELLRRELAGPGRTCCSATCCGPGPIRPAAAACCPPGCLLTPWMSARCTSRRWTRCGISR